MLAKFKLAKPFGPPRLRDNFQQIVDRLNQIAPIAGTGIAIDEKPDGRQISAETNPSSPGNKASTGGSGSQSTNPHIAFYMSDASDGGVSKVLIADGKINGTFPSGMGGGNYILTVPTSATYIILAGVTFNPTTLGENSWFLDIELPEDVPESRVEDADNGFLYWQIGYVYFSDDTMTIVNTKVGDINFAFSYGAYNGKPALLPIDTGPGWLDLVALET